MERVRPETLRESLAELLASGPHQGGGPSDVARMLLIAAPHRQALVQVFRTHLVRPMFDTIRRFVSYVDGFYGIARDEAETSAGARAVMSLFVGYFVTSMMLGDSGQDEAIVDAALATMGWTEPASRAQRPSCPSS